MTDIDYSDIEDDDWPHRLKITLPEEDQPDPKWGTGVCSCGMWACTSHRAGAIITLHEIHRVLAMRGTA